MHGLKDSTIGDPLPDGWLDGFPLIEWGRLAEPQVDGYDRKIVTAMARVRYGFEDKTVRADPPNWLDGWVPLVRRDASPELPAASFEHPNLAKGAALLGLWPAMYEFVRSCCTGFAPIWTPGKPEASTLGGCCCGALAAWGGITTTIDNPVGFVGGVVHEMGHWKLHALGVHLEAWDGLLLANDPAELYDSPIRKDKQRPMGAVLQAQYSYLHVLEAELRAARAGEPFTMIPDNAARLVEGADTIRKSLRPTPAGLAFVNACLVWGDRLIEEAAALGKAGG